MNEEWREVIGFPNYEVSDHGRVRSWNNRYGRRQIPHPLKVAIKKNCGYLCVTLSQNGINQQELVHRLVLQTFTGACPDGYEACHYNGDREDNRLSNLRWDTRKNNCCDDLRNGTRTRGTMISILTEQEVLAIRADKRAQRTIAKDYGVDPTQISRIKRRKSWRWL